MRVVVDLNDICIFAETDSQQVHSPGYALLQPGQDPVLGDKALQQSRLAPGITANRFWRDLSLNPVGVAHPQVRHQADLVWHHVKQINALLPLDQALFLCPSHYTEEQLGLLSGILKAQEIVPAALVKRALTVGNLHPQADCYLELQLHQMLLTSLQSEDGELVAENTRALQGDGLVGAFDLMLKAIQQRFIKETRFDPLHHANTEQQLVDALPELLNQLRRNETTVAHLQTGQDEYRAEIRRDELAKILSPLWQEISAVLPEGSNVLVDHTLYQLPGFDSLALSTTEVEINQLPGAARNLPIPEFADSDAPMYLTRASVLQTQPDTVPSTEDEPKARGDSQAPATSGNNTTDDLPTHLLCQGVALRSSSIWLGVSDQGRLVLSEHEPKNKIALCVPAASGLELEALGDIHINGERLVGKRLLQLADHLSSTEVPGGATAIQVVGDVD